MDNGNVIQFPGGQKRKPEASQKETSQPGPTAKPAGKKPSKGLVTGSILAVILFTGAVNRFAFQNPRVQSLSASSVAGSRAIASVDANQWKRDAQWEKQIAESLASTQTRSLASSQIGHPATLEDRLRFGVLDDLKYTIYKPEAGFIQSITLQGDGSEPSYIGDRRRFLTDYGSLLAPAFASAELKSVETSGSTTQENYVLYDKDQRPTGEAHLKLDRYQRLLSLKVEPQI